MKKWKLCNEAILESLQIYGAVKIWVPFAEILVNVNNVKSIIWFCPWKINIFFNYLNHDISLTFNTSLCQQKEEIVGEILAFENCNGLSVAKWAQHISVLLIFLARRFFSSDTHFVIPCSRYRFAEYIR